MSSENPYPAAGSSATENRSVRVVVRDIVGTVAPNELPIVEGLASLDAEVAIRRLSGSRGRREPLGFGVEEITVLATPIIWLAVNEAATRAGAAAAEGAAKGAKALLRKVFRRPSAPADVPPLTAEQLREVHHYVLELAQQRGVNTEQADVIANAVVARLALSPSDQAWAPGGPGDPDHPGGPRQ
ncbi:hypothetical protein [Nocardia sp. NPDC006630]|uniref:hypothetical protein n=1 Tax=Nocardia sp. NPDC006630 TaxID=3157181 RepID=UPI0033AC24A3